jgi:lipopolysaccharide transport protein LptA
VIHPKDLLNFLKNEPAALAKSVPTEIAPSYSIRAMDFYSSQNDQPAFRMLSRKSNLYQTQELIHSRDARLELPDGTWIEAKEMAMWQNQDLSHLYGNVVVWLPSGMTLRTEYAEIRSKPKLQINIPMTEKVIGHQEAPGRLDFESHGMTYSEAEQEEIQLLSHVTVRIQGEPTTQVNSDFALYQPVRDLLQFQMEERRPIDQQFVQVKQPDLKIRSRSLEIQLIPAKTKGQSQGQSIDLITALGDVNIDDRHDPKHPATGTSGKGLFYPKLNEIVLTDFPQVYQDGDTITGDQIIFNRNRDIIEVKQSNAIYQRR